MARAVSWTNVTTAVILAGASFGIGRYTAPSGSSNIENSNNANVLKSFSEDLTSAETSLKVLANYRNDFNAMAEENAKLQGEVKQLEKVKEFAKAISELGK